MTILSLCINYIHLKVLNSKSQSISCNSVEGQIFLISEAEKHLLDQIMRTSQNKNIKQLLQTRTLALLQEID